MLLLSISGILFLIFGYFAITLPIIGRQFEEDARFFIGYQPRASSISLYARQVRPILNWGSKVLFLLSGAWFIYLLVLHFK